MPDFRGLTRRQLRAFSATVERGSVSGAALTLGVTPPAISTQLKLLEDMVGAPLFHRDSSKPFSPTEIGAEVLNLALDFERLAARTAERVDALISGATGSVAFGVVSTGKYLAPYFVAAFNRAFPDIRVTLEIGNREEIIAGLERDEFDVALMGRPPAHLRVETFTLGDHPHILIAPPGHRLETDNEILAEDLVEERFLAREPGSGTRLLMERFLARLGGGRPFNVVEMGTNETIKQSVMAGLGLAIISAHTCRMELADRHLIALPVTGLPLVRQWFLLTRIAPAPSRAGLKFRDFFIANRARLWPKV
ncbi:LysR family transcriptional regulator [Rhodoblastus acidophilus]|uniref:HTH-type transcriptional regulator CbbR n=1 Tax=Rhodoblastus acidophilus TaxID=1074 RepID=A0A6N8DNU9_RHOAC|nr:LysR family transcriptional regulator [Rhodoblastus acidophilus]MCW2273470.1 DNA-binding transcriptional LysR family regulator [Rhodoblastus acidophilus]MTV30444.1 LysR family transcriptional regulator [Rhodoblastus acidophilus]